MNRYPERIQNINNSKIRDSKEKDFSKKWSKYFLNSDNVLFKKIIKKKYSTQGILLL